MNKIKIAIIGAGHWGPNLIRNFHENENSEVVFVLDKDEERLQQVKKRFPEIIVSKDNLLPILNIDATVIATPTSTHFELAQRSLSYDHHVLIEKPICIKSSEAKKLIDQAEKSNLTLMVGHTFLYNNAVQQIKKYINDGELGEIYLVSMTRTNLGPIRTDVNAAWDLASHDVSIVNYWFDNLPLDVLAVGQSWINKGIEDAIFATLHYPNEILVSIQASWLSPQKERKIVIVGSKKMLTYDDMNSLEPIRIYDKQVVEKSDYADTTEAFRAKTRTGDITIPPITLNEPLKNECEEFLNCIKYNKKPISNGDFGFKVVRTLEAIQQSIELKRTITI